MGVKEADPRAEESLQRRQNRSGVGVVPSAEELLLERARFRFGAGKDRGEGIRGDAFLPETVENVRNLVEARFEGKTPDDAKNETVERRDGPGVLHADHRAEKTRKGVGRTVDPAGFFEVVFGELFE